MNFPQAQSDNQIWTRSRCTLAISYPSFGFSVLMELVSNKAVPLDLFKLDDKKHDPRQKNGNIKTPQ